MMPWAQLPSEKEKLGRNDRLRLHRAPFSPSHRGKKKVLGKPGLERAPLTARRIRLIGPSAEIKGHGPPTPFFPAASHLRGRRLMPTPSMRPMLWLHWRALSWRPAPRGGFFFCPGLVSGFYSFGMHGMAWWGSMRARWRVLFLAVDAECSAGGYAADMSW